MPTNGPLNRKLRMALVGGGQGSFIGRVHCHGRRARQPGRPGRRGPVERSANGPRLRPPTTTFRPTGPTARTAS